MIRRDDNAPRPRGTSVLRPRRVHTRAAPRRGTPAPRVRRIFALLLLALAGSAGALTPPAAARSPAWAAPLTVDGPSQDIIGLSGTSVARDGTGGVVYLKKVDGVQHVFVARLIGGVFQPPEQLDASFSAPSSQPVIAAGNGGLLVVAFINGGSLYAVDRTSAQSAYDPPLDLFDGASNPSIQMTLLGKTYLAFTAIDGSGHDVRAAYYYHDKWALEPTPLNAVAADDAGTGSGRPAVAAAGDGVAIVAWGERGHIYSRRVWATSPSVVYEQADVPSLGGQMEVSADQPAVATGGDSSYAAVTFREVVTNGTVNQDRVLVNRLHGSVYDGVDDADGLSTPGSDGADQPQDAAAEYGSGFVLSAREDSNQLWTTVLGSNESPGATFQVDSLPNSAPPDGTSGMDGLFTGLITWQQNPLFGMPEIRARYYDGSMLQPEVVVSSPNSGPTDAAQGLATAGDLNGDGMIAWVQGTGASNRIVAAQLYAPPGAIAVQSAFQYVRTSQPTLVWSAAREPWGPLPYMVTLDGTPLASTTATSLAPGPLSQGPHTWRVTGTNPAGLSTAARTATVFVDTIPPSANLTLTGKLQVGSVVHVYVSYTDSPPPVAPADASGVVSVIVNWGDGTSYPITHGKFHVYPRAGRYRLTVTVTDRAGNVTTLTDQVRILPKPSPPTQSTTNAPF